MICQRPSEHPDTPSNRINGVGACRMCAAERSQKFKLANKRGRALYDALVARGVPTDADVIARLIAEREVGPTAWCEDD